jgi:prefoldin subunit 5
VADGLATTERLTAREEELNRRLDKLHKELELVHQGMNSELDQRWQAEDEIMQLQMENDQVQMHFGC